MTAYDPQLEESAVLGKSLERESTRKVLRVDGPLVRIVT